MLCSLGPRRAPESPSAQSLVAPRPASAGNRDSTTQPCAADGTVRMLLRRICYKAVRGVCVCAGSSVCEGARGRGSDGPTPLKLRSETTEFRRWCSFRLPAPVFYLMLKPNRPTDPEIQRQKPEKPTCGVCVRERDAWGGSRRARTPPPRNATLHTTAPSAYTSGREPARGVRASLDHASHSGWVERGGNMSVAALRRACVEVESSPAPAALLRPRHQTDDSADEDRWGSGADSDEEQQARVPITGVAEAERVAAATRLRGRLAAKMRPAGHAAPAAQHQHLNLGAVCRRAPKCAAADVDEDSTVLSSEEDALMSRGTVLSASDGTLTSRLDSTGYESCCDTELSAKETPRLGEAVMNKCESDQKGENVAVSEETGVPLADIKEADDDDWEEWEIQAFREQQEQIARDCRLLAELEEQRLREEREAQEQLEMCRFLASQRLAEMERMAATKKFGGSRALSGEEAAGPRPGTPDEVIFVRQPFVRGMRVRIHSLQRHSELNGLEAVVTELMGVRIQIEVGDGRVLALKSDNLRACADESPSPDHSKIKRPTSAPAARSTHLEDRTASKGQGVRFGFKKLNSFFARRSSKVGVLPLQPEENECGAGQEEIHANDWPRGNRVAGRPSAAAAERSEPRIRPLTAR